MGYYRGGYIQAQLDLAKIFGQTLTYPTAQNAQQWKDKIENELSPENLYCDGELPWTVANMKRRDLLAALKIVNQAAGGAPLLTTNDQFLARIKKDLQATKAARLQTAVVTDGKTVGARVRLTNGVTGIIEKVNRTRFKVKGDDGRMWGVPPTCCTVIDDRRTVITGTAQQTVL